MNYLIIMMAAFAIAACTDSKESGSSTQPLTEAEARALSPVGEVCISSGELKDVFVPANRGRGNDRGEWREIDNRDFEPAYLYGDVDFDGRVATREDAMLAVKRIYVKQIESKKCPAVADIGTFPQGFGADGFYTAEDIYQWNQIKHGASFQGSGKLICQSQCEIINHLSPGFKKQ